MHSGSMLAQYLCHFLYFIMHYIMSICSNCIGVANHKDRGFCLYTSSGGKLISHTEQY